MDDMLVSKVSQMNIKSDAKLKTSSPNGASVSIGVSKQKEKPVANPWKSRESSSSVVESKASPSDQPIHGLLEDPEAWPNLNTKFESQHIETTNHVEEKQKTNEKLKWVRMDFDPKYQPRARYNAPNSVGSYYNNGSGSVGSRSRRVYGRNKYQSDGRTRGVNGYYRGGGPNRNMNKYVHEESYSNIQNNNDSEQYESKSKGEQYESSTNALPVDDSVKIDSSQVDSKASSPKVSNDVNEAQINPSASQRKVTRDRNSSGQQSIYSDPSRHRRNNVPDADIRSNQSTADIPPIIQSPQQPMMNSAYLLPTSLPGASPTLFNPVHMNLQPTPPILPDVYYSPVPNVPNQVDSNMSYSSQIAGPPSEVLHDVVDISQVTSYCSSIGWDKTIIPPALAENSFIKSAKSSSDATGDKTEKSSDAGETLSVDDQKISSGKREDVVIVDNKVYFVPKNVHQTKFLKFTSKMDYIRHHINYYFSKANLARDQHLLSIISENKNACPIKDLLQFNRIRWVNTTEAELHEAVTYCPLVTLSTGPDGKTCVVPTQLSDIMNVMPPDMAPHDISQAMILPTGANLPSQVVMNVSTSVVPEPVINVSADSVQSSGDGPGNSYATQSAPGSVQSNTPYEMQNTVATSQPLPSSMVMPILPPGTTTYAAPNVFPQNIPNAALINHSNMPQVGPQPMPPVGTPYISIHPSQSNYIFPASIYSHQNAAPFYPHPTNFAGASNSMAAQMQVLVAAQQNTFFHQQVAGSNGNLQAAVHNSPQIAPSVGRYSTPLLTANHQNPAAGILQLITQATQQVNDPTIFNRPIVASMGSNYYVPFTTTGHIPGQPSNHFIGHNLHTSHIPYVPPTTPNVSSQSNVPIGGAQPIRYSNMVSNPVNVGQPRSSPMTTTISTSMNSNSVHFTPAHNTCVGSSMHTKMSNESPVGNQSEQSVSRSDSLPGTND